jgi:Mrp family chromosome partitioning ATPase
MAVVGGRGGRRGGAPVVDHRLMQALAVRAMTAGVDGQAAVAVASVLHGEGATTIASNLAACVASSLGRRVVLVEANLRSPGLRGVFGLEDGPGLSDVLGGAAGLEQALRLPSRGPDGGGRLLVLPAGAGGAGLPADLMGPAVEHLIAALNGYAELLVFDGAPLQAYPDTVLLARHLDGVVLVVQAERSTADQGQAAVQAVQDGGGRVLGAVLNRTRTYIPRLLDRLLA